MSSFFSSTEFYVIASMIAAAIVTLCIKPAPRGEAIERLLSGTLCDASDPDTTPRITLSCTDDGNILLTRNGLHSLTSSGAVSLAATRIGSDLRIEERINPEPSGHPIDTAIFTIDFIPPGRYHIRYNSDNLGLFTAFYLTVRPTTTLTRPLCP